MIENAKYSLHFLLFSEYFMQTRLAKFSTIQCSLIKSMPNKIYFKM